MPGRFHFAAQVPVGINHSLSVSPYWGTDTRVFRIVWMKPGHTENLASTEVHFDGSEVTLRAPQP